MTLEVKTEKEFVFKCPSLLEVLSIYVSEQTQVHLPKDFFTSNRYFASCVSESLFTDHSKASRYEWRMVKKIWRILKLRADISVASLSPVKLADALSNFLATTDSTVLESLSLSLVSKRLLKTLSLSHLLLQYNSEMSVDDGKCLRVLNFIW